MRTRAVALGLGMVALVLADLRSRVSLARRSRIIATAKGPIEVEITGDGAGVLVLHGGLGGFDQGSWIARAHLAVRHPQGVTRVVMLSAASGPVADPPMGVAWFALRASVDVTKSLLSAALDPVKRQLAAGLFRTFASPERRVRGGLRDLRLSGSFPPPKGITVAALVVHGTADDAVPFEHAERTVRGCMSGTLIPIDGGRHLSLVTHAEVGERVRGFLTAA